MSINYAAIPYGQLETTGNLSQYQRAELVHDDDPASAIMLDFKHVAEHTISSDINLDDAINDIQCSGNHLLLVTNENHDLIGIITSFDLLGSKPITIMEQKRAERQNISVAMLMRPIEEIPVITLDEVQMAKVGNVVTTLHNAKRNHALVINEQNQLCGLFSAANISKQLHRNIVLNQ